jgi:hypothetical protein
MTSNPERGPFSERMFRARIVESVRRDDFFGIEIEVPLSAHTGRNNTGPCGLSIIRSTSVRPIDIDPDSDSDLEQQHLRYEITIGIVIEDPLSAHTGRNNTGSYGLSTTRSTSVRAIDIDPDPDSDSDSDSDLEQQHLRLLICNDLHGATHLVETAESSSLWPRR